MIWNLSLVTSFRLVDLTKFQPELQSYDLSEMTGQCDFLYAVLLGCYFLFGCFLFLLFRCSFVFENVFCLCQFSEPLTEWALKGPEGKPRNTLANIHVNRSPSAPPNGTYNHLIRGLFTGEREITKHFGNWWTRSDLACVPGNPVSSWSPCESRDFEGSENK